MKKFFLWCVMVMLCIGLLSACAPNGPNNGTDTSVDRHDVIENTTLSDMTSSVDNEIYTAKYDFELNGDVILEPSFDGKYLTGKILCTITCISGTDYTSDSIFSSPHAWLIMPDGTKYAFHPYHPSSDTQTYIKPGDVFEKWLHFSYIPLDFKPGQYNIFVSQYNTDDGNTVGSQKLFENVVVRFETEDTTAQ